MEQSRRRFPGFQSYSNSDADLFFGRDNEIARLRAEINTERVVVLHGKSGSGKSSLVNTGLRSNPDWQGWKIYPCRLGYNFRESTESLYQRFIAEIQKNTKQSEDRNIEPLPWFDGLVQDLGLPDDNLWALLKKIELAAPSKTADFLFVFDQFEEIFDCPEEEIVRLKTELSSVIDRATPYSYLQTWRNLGIDLSNLDINALMAPVQARILFILRSDRLSLLDRLSDALPGIFRGRMEIRMLSPEAATRVLKLTAALEGDFVSPPFQFDEAAINSILESLQNDGKEIEPVQLQIIGQTAEEIVIRYPSKSIIHPEDLGSISDIWSDFYDQAIAQLEPAERPLAKKMIEDKLVINGRRTIAHEYTLTRTIEPHSSLPERLVNLSLPEKLINLRLLRASTHLGDTYYEISNDILLEPINRSRMNRLLDEQRELGRADGKRRQKRRLVISLYFIITVVLLLAYFIYKYY